MDSRLKGVVQFCADASRPCWACMWEDSPALMDRVDAGSDQGDDLAGAWPLALDPDGVRLAAGGSSDRSLVVFDRETARGDRKSTRLNSSHVAISYAVFCLKKKKNKDAAK